MNKIYCMGCFGTYEEGIDVCPNCGYVKGTPAREAYHIQPGTVIRGRYIIGRVLGYGGFGVTYIGWDEVLQQKIAVKEYFPGDFATRIPGQTRVTVYDGERGEQFRAGLERFLSEAQRLAKLADTPGVVRIFDSFAENDTAYIVMEYLEGADLKHYLAKKGGRISFEETMRIMLPVLGVLREVHKEGLIHRDISPDNIYLTDDGEVKLLDFGAARYATTTHSKSLSVILKPGYAPEEQYRSRGNQGPWSDVYAAAATIYRMLTGQTPEEAMERAVRDNLKDPSELGVKLPKNAETAIMNALNVKAENRTQSAEEFEQALLSETEVIRNRVKQQKSDAGRWPLWLKALLPAAVSAVLLFGILLAQGVIKFSPGEKEKPLGVVQLAANMAEVPNIIGKTVNDAQQRTEEKGFVLQIQSKEASSNVPVDCVMKQQPENGTLQQGSAIYVILSSGPEMELVPDVTDRMLETVMEDLGSLGFEVIYSEDYTNTTAPGAVSVQSQPGGVMYGKGKSIVLNVSLGMENAPQVQQVIMPDIKGMDFEAARQQLLGMGVYLAKGSVEWSETKPKGLILAQETRKGSEIAAGDTVFVTVSLGIEQTLVPDVQYKPQDEAENLLSSAKLNITVKRKYSDVVPKGNVISQSIAANTTVDVHTDITIEVSLGKKDEAWTVWADNLPKGVTDKGYEIEEKTQYHSRKYIETISGWTDWSNSKLSGDIVESKAQYRTRDKEFAWTLSAQSGWTATGKSRGSGTYTEWGAWSDWTTASHSNSAIKEVQTSQQYKYGRYMLSNGVSHFCMVTATNVYGSSITGTYQTSEWSTTPGTKASFSQYYSLASPMTFTSDGATFTRRSDRLAEKWTAPNGKTYYHEYKRTIYKYRTRTEIPEYEYWRWPAWTNNWVSGVYSGNTANREVEQEYSYKIRTVDAGAWSEWQFDSIAEKSGIQVKTRTVYRYRLKED